MGMKFMAANLPAPRPMKDGWALDGYVAFYYSHERALTPLFAVNLAGIELTDGIKSILLDAFSAGREEGETIGKEKAKREIRAALGLQL